MSDLQRNIDVIRGHHDRLNRGDIEAAAMDFAEKTSSGGRPVGRAGIRLVFRDIVGTFPDWRMVIEDIVAADDHVIVRAAASGTHKGVGRLPVNGGYLVGVAPTGKRFSVQHIHWYHLAGGEIVEHFVCSDDIFMMTQLGLLPAPPPVDWTTIGDI